MSIRILSTQTVTSICPVTHDGCCRNIGSGLYILPSALLQLASVWSDRGESSRCRMPQHASSRELDVMTTLRRCYVSCTGFLFGGDWSSSLPVWCARHCVVRCLHARLMISTSTLKATDDPFGPPVLTCMRCHVRTTVSETEASALPVHEFGTVCHVACEHLTSARNNLQPY